MIPEPLPNARRVEQLDLPLERDLFLRTLVGHLAASLQEVVGLDEASGFIGLVAHRMGDEIDAGYKQGLEVTTLTREQVGDVLVDLERRIQGDFFIIEQNDDTIVLGNRVCPFGDKVIGRPSLCMMTSNVFGSIAARNLGYARVAIEEAIARGDARCRVVVHLKATPDADGASGHEYFQT